MLRALRACLRNALIAAALVAAPMAGAFQTLRSELRMNGPEVMSAFEEQREVLQKSSAVIYDKRKEAIYGTVVSADGLILTKASELAEIGELSVRVDEELFREVEKVAVDEDWDVALVKVEAENLVPVRWATSEPEQGTWVVANGATSRSRRRALAGMVSANAREVPVGGGVALGVTLTADAAKLEIGDISEGSGAADAGLEKGDVILSLDGKQVKKRQELLKMLRDYKPGTKVPVKIRRGEEELELEVELKSRAEFFTDPMSRNDRSERISPGPAARHSRCAQLGGRADRQPQRGVRWCEYRTGQPGGELCDSGEGGAGDRGEVEGAKVARSGFRPLSRWWL
jgi:serine protease Do